MENNIGVEFDVKKYSLTGYSIGTFVFNYREILNDDDEKEVEIDVYKNSSPVILYIKTYKAPFIQEASPVDMCEALYEEFYLPHENEDNDDTQKITKTKKRYIK